MIDHVSIAVHDLERLRTIPHVVLATLGCGMLVPRPGTSASARVSGVLAEQARAMTPVDADSGSSHCLRASNAEAVQAFHAAARRAAALLTGAGPRPDTRRLLRGLHRDPEGDKIEAVTFRRPG